MSLTKVTRFVRSTEVISECSNSNVVSLPLTPDQAKERVLAHWDYLDRLCQQRFPLSSNLAHEGLLFIMEQLEKDDWYRIRTWQGKGRFSTYITTLSSRLLTDFQRKKEGHIRPPAWIREKADPIWLNGYRLLVTEGLERQEVINKLAVLYPGKDPWFFAEVVMSIVARCDIRPRQPQRAVSIDDIGETGSEHFSPQTQLAIDQEEMTAVLWQLLQGNAPDNAVNQRIQTLCDRLRPHIALSDNDCLMLRLRFVDGLKMKGIARMMNLDGDPYKRLNKILAQLRRAFEKAEMGDLL